MSQDDQVADTWKQKETVLKFIIKLALVLLAVWATFTFIFGIRQVSGEAMYPRLRDGDLILYYRLEKNYQIGDVVTFQMNDATFFGRIVAQGGDVVELNEDGQLLVNGNVQQEEIFYPTEPQDGDITYPYTVEEDSFLYCAIIAQMDLTVEPTALFHKVTWMARLLQSFAAGEFKNAS
jgi:signal peptidase I